MNNYFVPDSKDYPLRHDRVVSVNGGAVEQEWDAVDVTDLMFEGRVNTVHAVWFIRDIVKIFKMVRDKA